MDEECWKIKILVHRNRCVCAPGAAVKKEAVCRWRWQAGLLAVAGHAFGGWEPGHRREVLPAMGLSAIHGQGDVTVV